jgi:hypothetical protein
MWCVEISTNPSLDEPNIWEVTCNYEGISIPGRGVEPSQYAAFFGYGNYASSASTPFTESELPWHTPPTLVFEEPGVYEEMTGRAFGSIGFQKIRVDGSPNSSTALYTSDGSPNYTEEAPFSDLRSTISDGTWEVDAPNAPIVNSAGETFTDVPTVQRQMKTYTWRWSMPAFPSGSTSFEDRPWYEKWNDLEDSFNSNGIQIMGVSIPEFTGRVKSAKQKKMAFLGYPYYEFELTVEVRKRGWVDAILNNGNRYKLTSDASTLTPYNNESGDGAAALKLDANGCKLAASESSTPYWGIYVMHPWRSWAFLSLPSENCPSYFAAGVE